MHPQMQTVTMLQFRYRTGEDKSESNQDQWPRMLDEEDKEYKNNKSAYTGSH